MNNLETRVTTLEIDVDTIIPKVTYISTNGTTTTTIGGTGVLIQGNQTIGQNLDIENNLVVSGDSTISNDLIAGTAVNYVSNNEHILRGTLLLNKIKGIDTSAQGDDTLTIESGLLYTTGTLVDIDATNITLSSDLDISEITIGSILNKDSQLTLNTRDINIGTNAIGMTNPTLDIGTYSKTTTKVSCKTIEITASQTTSIDSSYFLVLDANAIDIGTTSGTEINIGKSTTYVNIQGSSINIGTTGIFNTINIGNDYSILNINAGIGQFVNIDNFVNQLGF